MWRFQTHTAGLLVAALGLLCAAPAAAQTVFFDDFDGNDLKPHWQTPPPEHWDYEVRDSLLIVNQAFFPSSPFEPWNGVSIAADLPVHLDDFVLHARLGWESNSQWTVPISIRDSSGQQIATMRGGAGFITASTRAGRTQHFGNPGPGTHDFVIRRRGTDVDFLLNEVLLTTIPDFGFSAARVQFAFSEPYPQPPGHPPVHVDFIRVVPAPGTAAVGICAGLIFARRRR
jgi:hypothetical protein